MLTLDKLFKHYRRYGRSVIPLISPWCWGEDRSRNPNALATLALLRSALLALLLDHFPDLSLPQIKERLHSHPAACLGLLRKK